VGCAAKSRKSSNGTEDTKFLRFMMLSPGAIRSLRIPARSLTPTIAELRCARRQPRRARGRPAWHNLGDQLRMLDEVRLRLDDSGDEYLSVG
jgi:hypothetical protein